MTDNTPRPEPMSRESVLAKIAANTTVRADGCVIWNKGKSASGYGIICIDGKSHPVHRWLFFTLHPETSKDLLICHTCDVRTCCNAAHLFAGTHNDNTQDMLRKGRHFSARRTHCVHGHEFTEKNARRTTRDGGRYTVCRECQRIKAQKYREGQRARGIPHDNKEWLEAYKKRPDRIAKQRERSVKRWQATKAARAAKAASTEPSDAEGGG